MGADANEANGFSFPKLILRAGLVLALLGMGGAMIFRASHPGANAPYATQCRDSVSYFFVAACFLALFVGQYAWVPRILKIPLGDGLGAAQAAASLLLLFLGSATIWTTAPGVESGPWMMRPETALWTMAWLGELLFAVNVALAVKASGGVPKRPVPRPLADITPRRPARPAAKIVEPVVVEEERSAFAAWLNPTDAMHQFGIVAIFLIVGGFVFRQVFSVRLLVPWSGELRFVPMETLVWIGALPFAIFAAVYWVLGQRYGTAFENRMAKIHFALTILWLLDLLRLVVAWQYSLLSRFPVLTTSGFVTELGAIFFGCVALLGLSVRAESRRRVA